jgi:hypothetical protein
MTTVRSGFFIPGEGILDINWIRGWLAGWATHGEDKNAAVNETPIFQSSSP